MESLRILHNIVITDYACKKRPRASGCVDKKLLACCEFKYEIGLKAAPT